MEIFDLDVLMNYIFLYILSESNKMFLVGIILSMIFIALGFFRSSLNSRKNRIIALAQQVETLKAQLESTATNENNARQEAEQSGQAKSKLLSSLSHEIRTPMNGVLGMATLLEETNLTAEQREYTDTIISSGKILLNKVNEILINDMLDLSKIDSLSGIPEQKNVDLRNCIEEVLDMFAAKAAEAGIELLYEIDHDVPSQIISDSKRLQQVLINLVENAVKFTQKGEVFLGIHLLKDEGKNVPVISFEIRDSGIGIPAQIAPQLFTGILSRDYSTKNKPTGKGFGLVICKKLVEQMGGQIKALNREQGGTTFQFSIPTVASIQAAFKSVNYTMAGFEGQQILIVVSNLSAGNILKNQLEQWKLLPVIATTGKQALEILSQVSFGLVITETNIPEMNGIQLAQTIRNQYPKIPVLLLNPVNDERYKPQEEIFGAVLNKPVRQHLLFDNMLSQLRHSNKGSEAEQAATRKLSENFSIKYPLRVLIAEDNPVNQKWTIKILSKMGYRPDIAENGKIVLEMVGHETYDLILMDVQMPEMDGLEATRMIRLCLDKQPVIIAMTANVMHGDRQACMQAGMDDYISKPVELGELVNMLEKWALVIKERK
ncbi:MAG: rcsC 4 [Chitinophagaceae bacterium]|nr:rcsC 4 [Chitinophagaceae bacterium]